MILLNGLHCKLTGKNTRKQTAYVDYRNDTKYARCGLAFSFIYEQIYVCMVNKVNILKRILWEIPINKFYLIERVVVPKFLALTRVVTLIWISIVLFNEEIYWIEKCS